MQLGPYELPKHRWTDEFFTKKIMLLIMSLRLTLLVNFLKHFVISSYWPIDWLLEVKGEKAGFMNSPKLPPVWGKEGFLLFWFGWGFRCSFFMIGEGI